MPSAARGQSGERATFAQDDRKVAVPAVAIEARVECVHAAPEILKPNGRYVDPLRWRPLIMSFRHFFALGEQVEGSRLARGPEDNYAPWKGGGARALAGRVLSAWSHHAHAVPDPPESEGP